jgi:hypothetical protein
MAGWSHDDHVIGFLERRRRFRLLEGVSLNRDSLDASKGFLNCGRGLTKGGFSYSLLDVGDLFLCKPLIGCG